MGLLEGTSVYTGLHRNTQGYAGIHGGTQVYAGIDGGTWVHTGIHWYTQVYTGIYSTVHRYGNKLMRVASDLHACGGHEPVSALTQHTCTSNYDSRDISEHP